MRDVAIAPITDAFCAQIDLMEALDLDVASDFLVMAATLCWLKSCELMPRQTQADLGDEDEATEVREQLHRRLLDYQRFREAADALNQRPMLDRDVFSVVPPVLDDEIKRPVSPGTDALGLLQIYYELLQRQRKPAPVHEVTLEHYTLQEMAVWILDRLDASPRDLADLLGELDSRTDRVVGFLASLEMARLNLLAIEQSEHLGAVVLRAFGPSAGADLSALNGSVG